jgi:hypothetical protein
MVIMSTILILYLFSVLFSYLVLYSDYLILLEKGYKFRLHEKIVGLFIVPIFPLLNVVLCALILAEKIL